MYNRLYKGGSNLEGGTLLQLRNLINRRNIATDISGRFNEAVDFFELIVRCYITTAAMQYFRMASTTDTPKQNMFLLGAPAHRKWHSLKQAVSSIIDNYVVVDQLQGKEPPPVSTSATNPHVHRIQGEHTYACLPALPPPRKKPRKLPEWLGKSAQASPSLAVRTTAPDGVLEYSCAVLNDGLLMLEFRDAIHEGDGERIARCWKVMLLYFFYGKRSKYAIEAVHLHAALNGSLSLCLREELLWSRVVNTRGGAGMNIPSDLYMEHLNRTLKDYLKGLGANVSDSTILQAGKSLRGLMELTKHFDKICDISPDSIHHTKYSPGNNQEMIISELGESRVFDYVPGRYHPSFKDIKAHISSSINTSKLVSMIKKHQQSIADFMELRQILKRV